VSGISAKAAHVRINAVRRERIGSLDSAKKSPPDKRTRECGESSIFAAFANGRFAAAREAPMNVR
jgi:hypothetical protein